MLKANWAGSLTGRAMAQFLTTDFADFTNDTDAFTRAIRAIRGYDPFSAPRREWSASPVLGECNEA